MNNSHTPNLSSDNATPILSALLQTMYDSISMIDDVTPLLPVLVLAVYDICSSSDVASVDIKILRSLVDNINTSDNVRPYVQLITNLYDQIVINDPASPLLPYLTKVLADLMDVSEYPRKSRTLVRLDTGDIELVPRGTKGKYSIKM